LNALPFWLLLAALAPAAVFLASRWPLDTAPRSRAVAVHIAGAAAFALVHAAAVAFVNAARMGWTFPYAAGFSKTLSFAFLVEVLIYAVIVGAAHAVRFHAESRERERLAAALQVSLAEAQLQGLRAQLNPHFLFNTLNAVSVLALKGEHDAVARVVALLSDILRACLDERRGQEGPLADELLVMDRYLEIQRIRFPDRLTVETDIARDVYGALVPTLILQPIVENAVTHGVATSPGHGRVRIAALRDNGVLRLTVADTGPGFGASRANGTGLGLANTRARLRQLYGDAQSLTTGAAPEGGALVQIVVPYKPAWPAPSER
jgi:LytS/YehU family sensor histidine kinase